MSADNYVVVRRFGENNYRWGMWFMSEDDPDFSDKNFKHGPFKTPLDASKNAYEVLMIIEYGIEYEDGCFTNNKTHQS